MLPVQDWYQWLRFRGEQIARSGPLPFALLVALSAFASSCGGGGGGSATAPPPPPPPVTVTVSAPSSRIATGATAQFSVTVQNASNPAVNWTINDVPGGNTNVGVIDTSGLYTAPSTLPNPPAVTVKAVLAADSTKSASAALTVSAVSGPNFGVFSWRNDNTLSGANTQETALTAGTVGGGHFGKLFSCPVDGNVYAQPLYTANLSIPQKGLHNVVFAATAHDSVYAFDADATPCQVLWKTSFLDVGVTPVPSADVGSSDIAPEVGITGTPAIDPNTKTLYVVAKTKESGTYKQRLHALDLLTGGEKFGAPVVLAASVSGNGDGNDGLGHVAFSALRENQQGGLLLANGKVYAAFGGHGNTDPFHGWLFAYSATTLAQTAVLNTTPNGSHGGMGQSGAAPSADGAGNIFVVTGNGTFDLSPPRSDYGESVLRLNGNSLGVADFFTASNQAVLNTNNPPSDLGGGGVVLLPDQTGSAHVHTAIILGQGVGQLGTLYLLDRDSLGQYKTGPGGGDLVVQAIGLASGTLASAAYWTGNGTNVYVAAANAHLQMFQLTNAVLSSGATSATTFGAPGATPSVSANTTTNGIVWVIDSSGSATSQPAVLHAYDASNVATQLYDSSAKSGDAAGAAVKFAVPTVAGGRVYLGTQTEISVYGALP